LSKKSNHITQHGANQRIFSFLKFSLTGVPDKIHLLGGCHK
jgi:hypothetical protein